MGVKYLIVLLSVVFLVEGRSPVFGYHERVGIPKALKLLAEERHVGRIVGGSQVTTAGAVPHQAGIVVLLTSGWTSICGGSLISNTRVLTAAHCWWDGERQARQFTIVLGSLTVFTGGTRIVTTDVTTHTSWNTEDITHDIAIVRFPSVAYSNVIQAIPIPTMADVNNDFSGLTGIATGYGKTSDAQNSFPQTTALHQTSLKVITNTECQRSFTIRIHGSHLCTSGEGAVGTCDGDSGGPLTVVHNNQRILVGIISFGLGDGCQARYPSVYTRVTAFLNWIQAQL